MAYCKSETVQVSIKYMVFSLCLHVFAVLQALQTLNQHQPVLLSSLVLVCFVKVCLHSHLNILHRNAMDKRKSPLVNMYNTIYDYTLNSGWIF